MAPAPRPEGERSGKSEHEASQSLPSQDELAGLPADGGPEFNRLVFEKSPYLLQHARNPVDWRPWGEEALRVAKEQDKPIFLSVGYSTCHWCHVMERESFEGPDVAALLNEHFVPVKVDREERPDLDDAYMTATQLLTRRGGWPNSLWLTPEGKPWAAGTYFPPEDRGSQPGFKTVLARAAAFWRDRREGVVRLAEQVAQAMHQAAALGAPTADSDLSKDVIESALEQLLRAFDGRRGGLRGAPKFPPHGILALLSYELRRRKRPALLEAYTRTLDAMALGGVRDHVGGGFHRYATDAEWFLPHFEKMLYDNAQLLRAYAEAYSLTGQERYRQTAQGICDWARREMTCPGGGFYSALDADSEGEEGKFYVWTRAEIEEVLGQEDAAFFCSIYRVRKGGNYREEATGQPTGANVLYLEQPLEAEARERDMTEEALEDRLLPMRERLLAARDKRPRPHLDDKVLAEWNGLMISGLVQAGRAFEAPALVREAERAARFVLENLGRHGRLLRFWRGEAAAVEGYLPDYVLFATACLDLHEATGKSDWLGEAKRLADEAVRLFGDEEGGFFLTAEGQQDSPLRLKPVQDQQVPSGNGAAALLLLRLFRRTGETRYAELARRTVGHFLPVLRDAPLAAASLLLAADHCLDAAGALSPEPGAQAVQAALAHQGPLRIARGQSAPLELDLTIVEGHSVYGPDAPSDGAFPTRARLASPAYLKIESISGPPGEESASQPGPVWRGRVRLAAHLAASKDAPLGEAVARVEVVCQACGEGTCLPPQTLSVETPVELVEEPDLHGAP